MWEIEKLKEYADVYGKAEAVMDAIAAKLRKEPGDDPCDTGDTHAG